MPSPDTIEHRVTKLETNEKNSRRDKLPERVGALEMKVAVLYARLTAFVFVAVFVATVIADIVKAKLQ